MHDTSARFSVKTELFDQCTLHLHLKDLQEWSVGVYNPKTNIRNVSGNLKNLSLATKTTHYLAWIEQAPLYFGQRWVG